MTREEAMMGLLVEMSVMAACLAKCVDEQWGTVKWAKEMSDLNLERPEFKEKTIKALNDQITEMQRRVAASGN